MVNPRFQRYSRPLLLAIPVGIFTLLGVAGIGTFNFISSLNCDEHIPKQYIGASGEQNKYVKHLLTLKDGELTRRLYISSMSVLVVKGTSQVVTERCTMTELIKERLLEGVEFVRDVNDGSPLTEFGYWDEDDPTLDDCQPDLTYVISYNNDICTRISHPLLAIGSAAGLQEQIAFVFTIIFIFIFSKGGCITVKSGKMFGAVADEQEQIDELKKQIELLKIVPKP
jgi:hypothetical protein